MLLETFPVGMLQCNCTILGDNETKEAVVIDPGDDPERILKVLEKHGLTLKQIICTHAHFDHVGAIHELQRLAGAPAAIHKDDWFLFDNLEMQSQWLGIEAPERGEIDRFIGDGDSVACRGIELGVLHTPGHTPGSLSFHVARDRNILFSGDTLFMSGIGRTDLWGGSHSEILRSIETKLMAFDEDTLVIPGHGPATTIGHEKHFNPFLRSK